VSAKRATVDFQNLRANFFTKRPRALRGLSPARWAEAPKKPLALELSRSASITSMCGTEGIR
jgi:hypothetical protein